MITAGHDTVLIKLSEGLRWQDFSITIKQEICINFASPRFRSNSEFFGGNLEVRRTSSGEEQSNW